MGSKTDKYILGFFNDEEILMDALVKVKTTGAKIHEVYSPFPIHGIDDILGYKRSRLSIAAFLFGLFGFSAGLSMQSWMMGFDWPMNVGGKPYLPWPSFVPVTFEFTILCTAFGMVGTFFYASKFFPGQEPRIPDPRITDDVFCIAIKVSEAGDVNLVNSTMLNNGAFEVKTKEVRL